MKLCVDLGTLGALDVPVELDPSALDAPRRQGRRAALDDSSSELVLWA